MTAAPATWTPPRYARGAHVVWSGHVAVVETDARWSAHGWAHDIRFGNGLRTTVAESALSAAPENLAAPQRWRGHPARPSQPAHHRPSPGAA